MYFPYRSKAVISIHALRGEGDLDPEAKRLPLIISIHALRGEGDPKYSVLSTALLKFQSTPSGGRATVVRALELIVRFISIHALRGEGDGASIADGMPLSNFNPRPPWGGRRFYHKNTSSSC